MFRITTHSKETGTTLELEGRLVGPWVDVLERYWHIVVGEKQNGLVVDLTGVTFCDRGGKAILARMYKEGATLHATGCMTTCLVEEIMNADRPWSAESNPCGEKKGD